MPVQRRWGDDRGSSPVEFVLVGSLLTVLTLAVLQLGFAFYVRNLVHDAALEGAHYAGLADSSLAEGEQRTELSIRRAFGDSFVQDVRAEQSVIGGSPSVRVTVSATLPVLGLLGVSSALEVSADAPQESFDG